MFSWESSLTNGCVIEACEALGLDRDEDWRRIAENDGSDIYQTPEWAALELEAAPGSARLLGLDLVGERVWVPLIIREWRGQPFAWSPYGYPSFIRAQGFRFDAETLVNELSLRLEQCGVVGAFVRLHPLVDTDIEECTTDRGAVVTQGPTASIDLRDGIDAAWDAMRARLRTDVRRLRRDGYFATTGWNRIDDFTAAYRATMQRVNADSYYFFSERYWEKLRNFPSGRAKLVSIMGPGGEFAAGGIFTSFGRTAQYHLGATHDDSLAAHPTKLMFWAATELAHQSDADFLHLGGGLGARRDGLYQLKSGFGRHEAAYRTLRVVSACESYAHLLGRADFVLDGKRFPPD